MSDEGPHAGWFQRPWWQREKEERGAQSMLGASEKPRVSQVTTAGHAPRTLPAPKLCSGHDFPLQVPEAARRALLPGTPTLCSLTHSLSPDQAAATPLQGNPHPLLRCTQARPGLSLTTPAVRATVCAGPGPAGGQALLWAPGRCLRM